MRSLTVEQNKTNRAVKDWQKHLLKILITLLLLTSSNYQNTDGSTEWWLGIKKIIGKWWYLELRQADYEINKWVVAKVLSVYENMTLYIYISIGLWSFVPIPNWNGCVFVDPAHSNCWTMTDVGFQPDQIYHIVEKTYDSSHNSKQKTYG